jgi:hypothetical protein
VNNPIVSQVNPHVSDRDVSLAPVADLVTFRSIYGDTQSPLVNSFINTRSFLGILALEEQQENQSPIERGKVGVRMLTLLDMLIFIETGWRGGFILSAAEQWLKLELTKNIKLMRELELLPNLLGQDWSSVFLQRFDGAVTCVQRRISSYILSAP